MTAKKPVWITLEAHEALRAWCRLRRVCPVEPGAERSPSRGRPPAKRSQRSHPSPQTARARRAHGRQQRHHTRIAVAYMEAAQAVLPTKQHSEILQMAAKMVGRQNGP